MTTGEKIAIYRKECGYTQESLGEKLGVTRQAVSKWESDTTFPETEKLILLSKLFNCSIDYLLNNDLVSNSKDINKDFDNEKLKEDKTIDKIFTTIWSASSFIITLLLYLCPFIVMQSSGFGNIQFNIYEMLFSSSYDFGNLLILFAFICQIIMICMGVVLLFKKDKTVFNIRFGFSLTESLLWVIILAIGIEAFQIGMALMILSSVGNSIGLGLIKYNKYNETLDVTLAKTQNNRLFTLLYSLITYLLLVATYFFPIIDFFHAGHENLFELITLDYMYISICSIVLIFTNLIVFILSIIIYKKNKRTLYILRIIISFISVISVIILYVLIMIEESKFIFYPQLGMYYLLIIEPIILLGLLLIKNNKFSNE